jgi:uncharacterized membrane protein
VKVLSKGIVVVAILGSTFSAQAASISKTELLKSCKGADSAKTVEALGQELRIPNINQMLDAKQLDSIKSADEAVQSALKQDLSKQAGEIVRQTKIMRDVISLITPATKKAIGESTMRGAHAKIAEALIVPMISGIADIYQNILGLSLIVSEAQMNKTKVSQEIQEQMTDKLQAALEQYAVLKVRLAGAQGKINIMSSQEQEVLSGELKVISAQVQSEFCTSLVNYVQK